MIGNPPYVRQELLSDYKQYFQRTYKVYHGMADLYSYFFEKGIGLLNNRGLFGIIVANKWIRANYGEPLRKWLKGQPIYQIIDFGDLPVFQGATTYPCIFIAGKEETDRIEVTNVRTLEFHKLADYVSENRIGVDPKSLDNSGWNLGSGAERLLLKKLHNIGISLEVYVKGKVNRGVLTGLNEAFAGATIRPSRLGSSRWSKRPPIPRRAIRDLQPSTRHEGGRWCSSSARLR